MPSKSKAQQRFMGMVHALNKGEMDPSDASPEVKKVAKSMKKKDAKDFASTKHKGKPNKVAQEWLKKTIRELIEQELNLEGTCGYGEEGELGDEPAGPHLLNIKKESFSELEAERYDKKLKSAIKRIAKKDRKKGLLLMNFYKKHWVEFMIKSKQALGESILNEGEKEKIEQLLIKYGNTPEDAKQMVSKTYDYIKKAYRNANASKKAEIMSSLMKFETMEQFSNLVEKCWKGYMIHPKRKTKKLFGKTYPNCIKKEAVDKQQGTTILNQLGGKRFIMFTGAKHFGVGKEGLSFKIGRNSKQVNHIKIDYDRGRDLYNMKFDWVTKKGIKTKKEVKGVYADMLQDVFSRHTGMATRF